MCHFHFLAGNNHYFFSVFGRDPTGKAGEFRVNAEGQHLSLVLSAGKDFAGHASVWFDNARVYPTTGFVTAAVTRFPLV